MKAKNQFFVFLIVIFGSLSCKKDKEPSKGEDCYEFSGFQETGNFYPFASFGRSTQPCFNPNNPNEFVFYYTDNSGGVQLRKYNILTQQNNEIITFNKKIYGQPKWGKNGWIAFTSLNNGYVEHIYVVKDNGDSLRQFTNSIANLYPAWDVGNNLYWAHSAVLGVPYYFLKQNIYSNNTDTVLKANGLNQGFSWVNDINRSNILISNTIINNQMCIGYANLNDSNISFVEVINLESKFKTDRPVGLCWSANEQFAYISIYNDGLYKLNISTKQYNKLIAYCDSKSYGTISCSSDGRYLVGERINSTVNHDKGVIYQNYKINLIDLATLKETELLLE